MTILTLPETHALTERGAAVRELLLRAGAVVEIDAQTSALIQSGMRVQQLLDRVADDLDIAGSIQIDSPELLAEAESIASRLATVASDSGEIERERKQLTAPLNAIVKLINAGYGAPREHVNALAAPLKSKILAYHQDQRRKAQEAEAEERAKREKSAREATEREVEAKRQAEAMLADAQKAQAAGSDITAQALAQAAGQQMDLARTEAHAAVMAIHTGIKAAPIAKAKGVRGRWTAQVTSKENLILHIARRIEAGDLSLVNLLEVDEAACNRKAALEEKGFNVPGLMAAFNESLAVRKAATV